MQVYCMLTADNVDDDEGGKKKKRERRLIWQSRQTGSCDTDPNNRPTSSCSISLVLSILSIVSGVSASCLGVHPPREPSLPPSVSSHMLPGRKLLASRLYASVAPLHSRHYFRSHLDPRMG
ncbi:hypothetical protein ACN38_g11031 [Penicillium nordicum]|uniref:Uncharacterized protein n=1 Tax=Penicillium nordicum TaxID=229535 RepID=A0A0M8NZF6_9EURO|nr:hypothetical protein ACN38_g11031 [Penicillium nordicum]